MSENFSVHISKTIEKDIADLRPYQARVAKALLALEPEPHKGHTLSGSLHGLRSLEFSLPGGVCRAIYAVKPDEGVCLMVIIGYHEGLYERAERRVKALRSRGVL